MGRPGAKGAALQASEACFSEGPEQIVCVLAKGAAGNLRGKPKPAGLELLSEGAERGNYPEAKPNEERLKGRRACKKNNSLWAVQQNLVFQMARLFPVVFM